MPRMQPFQNGNKIITNLAGDIINGGNGNAMYQRKNLKTLNFNGIESAPGTLSPRHNNVGRFNSYQASVPPTPQSTQSIYSHHLHGHNIPPPSTDREKRKMTRRDLRPTN